VIYYSNINEDNFAERKILESDSYENLICIAGSGERLIALLDHDSLKRVEVIDTNVEALYLNQLKLTALENFSVDVYLSFIGFYENEYNRIELFEKLKVSLPDDCQKFWQRNIKSINDGIINMGHFEKFISQLRPILKWFLGKGFYECFNKPFDECQSFPHLKWKLVRWLFSKRWAYTLSGNKDEAFISSDAYHKIIPDALHQSILNDTVYQNCIFHFIFNGHFHLVPEEFLPPSFNKPILEKIKKYLCEGKIHINYHNQDLLSFTNNLDTIYRGKSFFSCSDLLSFIDFKYVSNLLKLIQNKFKDKVTVVIRSFLRHRLNQQQITSLCDEFGNFNKEGACENTGMYEVYLINIEK
jgi:S-adenosylmethionine:diacylglycerol 3-amino-3-carboxypropyl transferase